MFFEGNFKEMLKEGMSKSEYLGWSENFIKEGISLMLLLICKDEVLQVGLREMLLKVQSLCRIIVCEYFYEDKKDFSDETVLWKIISFWKNNEVLMDEETEKFWLIKIEEMIIKMTDSIITHNMRNYYHECASFIVAYGETVESLENSGYKQFIMKEYREKYSRRRSFHKELRSCGMLN